MIGILDSGVGGLNSCYELRRLMPREDIIYLADSKNAPYGTKAKEELITLVGKNIRLLKGRGAESVLIACCTASSIYPYLSKEERDISIPIIEPAAKAAARHTRIAVIATDYTVASHAFKTAIQRINPSCEVTEIGAQILVSLVELGARDRELFPREATLLGRLTERIKSIDAECLVLGCTHFSHLEAELSLRLPGVELVSPARLGARHAREVLGKTRSRAQDGGRGKTKSDESNIGSGRCFFIA